MLKFPETTVEVSKAFHKATEEGLLPKNGILFECLRDQALSYEQSNLPHKKNEEWRYFPFKKAFTGRYPFPPSYELPKEKYSALKETSLLQSSTVLEIRDADIPKDFQMEGVQLWSWKQYLLGNADPGAEIKEKILKSLKEKRDSLCSLNNLFSGGGMILSIEKPLRNPLEIQFLFNPFDKQQNFQFRIFLFVKKNAKAEILETFYGSTSQETKNPPEANSNEEKSLFFHLQTDCFVEEEAELDYIRLDQGNEKDVFLNHTFGALDKKAKSHFLTMSFKSGFSRYETYLKQKRESHSEVRGLNFVDKKRLTEHRVFISHLEEKGFSNQLYQSFIFDSASHIFKGLISIAKEAQKTDANQLNRNWILGEKAFSASSPELDVLADDVKAHHGASISSLAENKELLFYLQSRGLSYEKAFELVLAGAVLELLSITKKQTKNILLNLIQNLLKTTYKDSLKALKYRG